jgi:hypothetical protein
MAQKNVIKANLLSPIVRTANFSYERAMNDNSSLQLGFFYTGARSGEVKLRGWAVTPEYRFYLSSTPAPHGVYVAPWFRYQNLDAEDETTGIYTSGTLTSYGGGIVVGKQWIFKERVSLDIFIGPQYFSANFDEDPGSTGSVEVATADGFWFRFGFNLGIAF